MVFQVLDYVDNEWVSLLKLCGRNLPANIKSTGSQMRVLFRSNALGSNSGFKVIRVSSLNPLVWLLLSSALPV
jgi:hypothetical protein